MAINEARDGYFGNRESNSMKRLNRFTQIGLTALLVFTAACSTAASPGEPKEAGQSRLQIAEAMFQERCKKSGEFIKRTVDNVEGIYLLKLRPNEINRGN
ncbi:MAG TPA: hypothetical protein VL381_01815, partial [Rhodocyclaceae bacterium]|nr:hypothetical protein [Rhodocyclaceae bacterium]